MVVRIWGINCIGLRLETLECIRVTFDINIAVGLG